MEPYHFLYALYKEGFFPPGQEFTGKTRILNMIEFAILGGKIPLFKT